MYEKVFDQDVQKKMDDFFIKNMASHGKIKTFKKGEIISQDNFECIYILLEGELNQIMHSKEGDEIIFFRIVEGNIFGEMAFFDRSSTFAVNKAITKGNFSVVNREIVESKLKENPDIYNYFLMSIIRKYRAVMFELASLHFNDATGRLADFFVRLYYTENADQKNNISIVLTHEEIAHRLGLNRITVTNTMKKFKEKNLIEISRRKLIIKDIEGLKKMTNTPIE
ncbi:MAG: Crp/Fnr family transcriptional regulator [Proteocatella sp.]